MDADALAGLFIANLLATAVPGPNVALVAGTAARRGITEGLAVMAGILLAEAAWTGLALLTLGGLVDVARLDLETLRLLGGACLCALGFAAVLATEEAGPATAPKVPRPARHAVLLGALIGFVNPMVFVFMAAALPQFLPTGGLDPAAWGAAIAVVTVSAALGLAPYLVVSATLIPRRRALQVSRGFGAILCVIGATAFTHG